MKPFVMLFAACVLLYSTAARAQNASVEDRYFDIYSLTLRADNQASRGQLDQAHTNYTKAIVALKKLQEDYPLWNAKVVRYRLDYLNGKIAATASTKKPAAPSKADLSDEPVKPGDTASPVEFILKFKSGQRYTFTEAESVKIQSDQMDRATLAKLARTTSDLMVITALKDLDGGGQEIQAEQLDTKVDGKDAPDNPTAGLKIKFLTDSHGTVETIENYDEIMDHLTKGMTADKLDLVKSVFTKDRLKQMVTFNEDIPDHPVKVGDTWEHTSEKELSGLTGPMPVKIDSKYTFRGWATHGGAKYAVVDFSADFAGSSSADMNGPASAEKATMSFKHQGNITGKMWYSPDQGLIVQQNEETKYALEPTVNGRSSGAIRVENGRVLKLSSIAPISQ